MKVHCKVSLIELNMPRHAAYIRLIIVRVLFNLYLALCKCAVGVIARSQLPWGIICRPQWGILPGLMTVILFPFFGLHTPTAYFSFSSFSYQALMYFIGLKFLLHITWYVAVGALLFLVNDRILLEGSGRPFDGWSLIRFAFAFHLFTYLFIFSRDDHQQ
jgi:hypothetical protein